jgi:ABC-type sugar transport system substrate-binding protein
MMKGLKLGKAGILFGLLITILGCGGKQETYTVGLAFNALDATPAMLLGLMAKRMDELGWKYIVTNADLDINKQLADMENMVIQKPDFILARAYEQILPELARTCVKNSIPLATMLIPNPGLDLDIPAVYGDRAVGIGDPEVLRGIPLANWIDKYVEDHPGFVPKIGFLVGQLDIDVHGMCERSLNVREFLTCEWVDVVTTEAQPQWSAQGGMKVAEDWIQKYTKEDMNIWLVWSDEMCVGVIQALQAAGKTPGEVMILSYDGLPIIEEYVEQGWVTVTSAIDLEKQAMEMINTVERVKAGERLSNDVYTQAIYLMTPQNIKDIKAGKPKGYWDYSEYYYKLKQ